MSGYSMVAGPDAERRFPQSFAKVKAAEDFLEAGRRHFACRHVIDGAVGIVCTDHLAFGLRCVPCLRDLLLRHPWTLEYACDECGRVVADGLRALVCSSYLDGVRTREPRGRSRTYVGVVTFTAVGCCSSCWRPE